MELKLTLLKVAVDTGTEVLPPPQAVSIRLAPVAVVAMGSKGALANICSKRRREVSAVGFIVMGL
jgi:hypothetical protein